MTKTPDSQIDKIIRVLSKTEEQREAEEVHFLSMSFKKKVFEGREIQDWWFLFRCIQSLIVAETQNIRVSKIQWIFVVSGSFEYHGMTYQPAEYLTINKEQSEYLSLKPNSTFIILTRSAMKLAKISCDDRKILEQRQFIKKVLFGSSDMSNREFNQIFNLMLSFKVKKGTYFDLKSFDDIIFIVVTGSLNLEHNWRRKLKLRELHEGSVFSTYLGRYFLRTGEELRKGRKFQFNYFATEETILLGIQIDHFYEDLRFNNYKFLVQNCWDLYLSRVEEVERIIQGLGMMKPEKKEVQKTIKEELEQKELRERTVSIPVAIEKRKFRKIIYNFFDERSNRRKAPNLAVKSARTISTFKNESFYNSHSKELKTEREFKRTEKSHLRSTTLPIEKTKKDKMNFSFSAKQLKTQANTIDSSNPEEKRHENVIKIDNFFRPEQFVSKKLKIRYETILSKLEKLKIPVGKTEHSQIKEQFKNEKQYFEHYVNERRIVKLGPKKRLLYKKRAGF